MDFPNCSCGRKMMPHHRQEKFHAGMIWLVCSSMNCQNTQMIKDENFNQNTTQNSTNPLRPANNPLSRQEEKRPKNFLPKE